MCSSHKGATLLEGVFAIAVLAFALVIFQYGLQHVPLAEVARDRDVALRVARAKLEELRHGGYDALPVSGSFSHAGFTYLPSATGALLISDYNDETKEVVVTVSWTSPKLATTTSVSLTTLVTEIGGL